MHQFVYKFHWSYASFVYCSAGTLFLLTTWTLNNRDLCTLIYGVKKGQACDVDFIE